MQNSAINQFQAPHSYSINHSKSLGQANGTPGAAQGQDVASGCATWIEQNNSLYTSIVNGTSGLSQQDQSQFMQWYQYAYQTAFGNSGSNWGGGVNGQAGMGMPPAQVPAGAKAGPSGNIVYNTAEGEFTYADGVAQPIDVFSDQFTLNVSVKAKVDVEKTTDTRTQPAQEVYKVTINDPSTNPAQTVLFLSTDTKLNLNTINGKNVTFHNNIDKDTMPDGKARFTVGTFTGESAGADGDIVESSIKGERSKDAAHADDPNYLVYRPTTGAETVVFNEQAGVNETHEVWGNAKIHWKPGDTVNVEVKNGDTVITVTHSADDNSTDTFIIKPGFTAELPDINKEYIRFNGTPPYDGKLPDAFKTRVKVPSLTGEPLQQQPPASGSGVIYQSVDHLHDWIKYVV